MNAIDFHSIDKYSILKQEEIARSRVMSSDRKLRVRVTTSDGQVYMVPRNYGEDAISTVMDRVNAVIGETRPDTSTKST